MSILKFNYALCAGFPSPATDYIQKRVDLNDHLIRNKEATYLFRVRGDSMNGVGIYEGDTLLVDRSIEAIHNTIVVATLDNEFTIKRLYNREGLVKLISENPAYAAITPKTEQELSIWGVVTFNLHKLY